jgi:AraC family transcriptional regulator, regulatory protein of adaptative response / methylated-DNA-[protein]-cysteine methyltransferase
MNPVRPKKDRARTPTEADPRWQLVLTRDQSSDGAFVYAVKTTGIYCRPSCPARLAKPENVAFFDTCESAESVGYRACRRCTPNALSLREKAARMVAKACRLIERSDTLPKLEDLAASLDVSPFHFHRQFKAITGLTPKAYGLARRARRLRDELDDKEQNVTQAIYGAGFNSNSRFYENAKGVLGMTPTAFRKGGLNAKITFAIGQCSLGAILVARSETGVCAILLGDDPDELARELQDRFPKANLCGGDSLFEKIVAKVVGFIEAPELGLDLPLDVRGTAFQQRVWQALQKIPVGQTVTYTEIARRIGAPDSIRAVAQACGANTIAVAIPCHRVVRSDAVISGYRWGVQRKHALLKREAKR